MRTPSNHAVNVANKLALGASRCALAQEVYETVIRFTESLEEANVGSDLAYLLGAITDTKSRKPFVDWSSEIMASPPDLYTILKAAFPHASHRVWKFIRQ